MGNRRYAKIRYPTTNIIERLHEIIISQRGFSGYVSKGLVDVGIEWASTNIEYALDKTPTLLLRGAAMMYAYTTFHAYSDGNKRTALMSTAFFFFLNHYFLIITDDAPEFTRDLAITCLDKPHVPLDEIRKTAEWLRMKIAPLPSGFGRGFLTFFLTQGSLDVQMFDAFFDKWLEHVKGRFLALKRNNHVEQALP